MGLCCSPNGAPHNIPAEYFINRHVQSSWTKLNWWWRDLSLVSWRVTSCAAKIQHFVSYFSFDFAQSYQILAHDQIHYYAVLQQQLRNKTEFSCRRKSEWLGWWMMSPIMSISIEINQPICIFNKMSKNDGNCTKNVSCLCILSWILFYLDFPSDDQFSRLCNLCPSWCGQSAWVIL